MLCVAVMLSVMVLGAGAAFSDQDQIENTEAVDACSALNIIGGYEDGSFHPERNIKRSEITKMICVALNGGQDPNVSTNAKPTFSDVRGTSAEWAEGYIESCVAQGIVSGVGGGRFAPNGNVTGAQLAKMLLICLGYNSDNEGFTGNAWETNVNVRAAQKHLYDGLEQLDTSAAVTRDQAAQMVWNALQAYEVEYKTTLVTDENGNLITQVVVQDKVVGNNNDKITLLYDKYEAYVNVGTLVTVDGKDLKLVIEGSDVADSDDPDVKDFTKVATDYSSLLGQKVKVVFTKSSNVLSVFATDSNTVYTVAANGVSKDDNRIKFDGNSYGVDLTNNGIKTYINGVESDPTTLNELDNNTLNPNMYTLVDSDNNGKIDTLSVEVYDVAQVTYAASDKIIANGVTYRYADHNIADGIAKDDWIVITKNLYNENKDIVKADVQTGTLNGIRLDQDVTPYFDGVGTDDANTYNEYQIGDTWFSGGEDLVQDNAISENDLNAVKAGDTVDYVAVNGIMFFVKKSTGDAVGRVADVAMVVAHNNNSLKDEVKIAFFDGTTKVVTVDSDSTVDFATLSKNPGKVYEYSVSGGEYSFEPLKPGVGDGNEKYENYYGDLTYRGEMDKAELDGTGDSYTTFNNMVIDDNAQVLLYLNKGNDVKQITGKQFKTMDKTNVTDNTAVYGFSGDMNGLDRIGALAVTVNSVDNLVKTWTNYGYIVTKPVKTGNNTIVYTIWTGKENVVVQEEKTNINDRAKGTVLGFDALTELTSAKASGNPTHLIEGAEKLDANEEITFTAITDSNASTVQFDTNPVGTTATELDVAGTVMYIDSSASDDLQIGLTEGSIRDAQKDDGKYLANALVIANGDDIELLIVDQGQYLANDIYKGSVVGTDTVYGDSSTPGTGTGDPEEVETLPSTSDMAITVDGNKGAARIVDNQLYVQFNSTGITQAQTKAVSGTLTITENGTGKISYVDFKDLEITKGTQASKVLKMAYTPASTTTSLTISATINVDEYYVAYQIGGKDVTADMVAAGATEYVKNEANAAINFTVKKPAGVSDFTIANDTSINVDTTNFAKVNQTADVAITSKLTAANKAPVVKLTVTNNKYEVTASVRSGAYSKDNGVLAVDIANAELNSSGGNVALTVVTTKALVATDNQIVVDYTIDGVAQTQKVEAGAAKNSFEIDLPTGALTKGVTLEVTSIKVQAKFNAITADITKTSANMDSNGNLKVMNGEKEVTTSDWIDVGTKLQLVATVTTNSSGSVELTPDTTTGLDSDVKTVEKDKTDEQVTWDYTMALGVTSLKAEVAAADA